MNFRGGCCIARYGGGNGGGGGGRYDMSKVDRIMLRYRPIAPRPDSGGSSSSPTEKNGSALTNVSSKSSRRGKRKYSKENNSSSSGSVNSNGNSKRRRNEEMKNGSCVGGEMVTLPLLPETPEKKDSPLQAKAVPELGAASSLWLSFNNGGDFNRRYQTELGTETVVASLLTVECVTERWVEAGEYELGCRDEEIKMNLERDTCPGFISDGSGRVIWTNGSYRELVVGKDQEQKMSVWLVMKERPLVTYRTFTCRMRLQYTCRDKEMSSITSFCDVWRMNDGGFAWRLDVDAALCLGR